MPVTLMQLHFASFAVINLRWDLHPQEGARAGRTRKKGKPDGFPFRSGAAEESRTLDLNLGKVALYQLSYCRKFWRREPESNRPTRICNPVHNRFAIAPG